MSPGPDDLCDDAQMQDLIGVANADSARGVDAIDAALAAFPGDARLHFLKGSLLIGLQRFIGAHQALSSAVRLSPEFHIARFQLGLFELTSGEADSAVATWKPLKALPGDHWMRRFVDGLEHLASDRFDECIADLSAGIAANQENLPLNVDMQRIVAECEGIVGKRMAVNIADRAGEVSATSFLLGASAGRKRQH